jgi:hypothetical protein
MTRAGVEVRALADAAGALSVAPKKIFVLGCCHRKAIESFASAQDLLSRISDEAIVDFDAG